MAADDAFYSKPGTSRGAVARQSFVGIVRTTREKTAVTAQDRAHRNAINREEKQ